MTCARLAAGAALGILASTAGAQVMSVSTTSVNLAPPDTMAYDVGMTLPVSFTVMVTGCAGALGCRVSIENAHVSSSIPIDLEWRLSLVSQAGTGSLGCTAVVPLLTWQALPAAPTGVMDTAIVSDPATACVATIEVRATGVSYGVHQFVAPVVSYWREILFQAMEK
jgi:hypothetical protein